MKEKVIDVADVQRDGSQIGAPAWNTWHSQLARSDLATALDQYSETELHPSEQAQAELQAVNLSR